MSELAPGLFSLSHPCSGVVVAKKCVSHRTSLEFSLRSKGEVASRLVRFRPGADAGATAISDTIVVFVFADPPHGPSLLDIYVVSHLRDISIARRGVSKKLPDRFFKQKAEPKLICYHVSLFFFA